MQKRRWQAPRWQEATLTDDGEPFHRPFYTGDKVFFRDSDIGIAVLRDEGSALVYASPYQVKSACGSFKPLSDNKHYDTIFELTREELREAAGEEPEPQIYGEVVLPKGLTQYDGGATVHVGTSISYLSHPVWFADWFYDREGDPQMVWEKQVLYAALAMRDEEFINKTKLHEPFERRRSYSMMLKEYGRVKPSEINALARQFEGVTHTITVRVIEGYQSEAAYEAFLKRWVKKAKLPLKPPPNGL